MRKCLATILACAIASFALAQGTADQPAEPVGIGALVGMAFFLLLATLIVVSFLCKLLVIAGLVPKKTTGRAYRLILWLANAAGDVRVTRSDDDRGSRRSSASGGGGSSGGGGTSGDY